jgi:GDP-L-fucose synthase
MREKNATIYVADVQGLVGSALLTELRRRGYDRLLPEKNAAPNLTQWPILDEYFEQHRPDYVFLVGEQTGGIKANQKYPADLMRDNLLANCHVMESACRHGVKKLLYLASACVYPKFSAQPMRVESLMTGPLEPTNEAYGTAKLAGLYLCQAYRRQFNRSFIAAIPANVFGPGDDFSFEDSHVIGALIRRMHEAKALGRTRVEVWGSGNPRREFIFSHDLARACLFLMDHYESDEPINLGVGSDCSIREIAETIRNVVGFPGELVFDRSKPDGMPAKLLDSSRLRQMGWKPSTSIREALGIAYEWFLKHDRDARGEANGRPLL